MIAGVFLDVGNVLLDEDPLTYRVFRLHVEAIRRARPDRNFVDLLAEREARASSGSRWPVYEVASSYLDEAGCAEVWAAADREVRADFAALSPQIPGARALVDCLGRQFRLGLIANQPREARARLAALGLLDRVEVVAFSEEEGLAKPDPALFLRALDRAGLAPSQALMAGDRLDNDVAPAAALGLATAWVRWPRRSAKGWATDDPDALAYLRSLERIDARRAASWSGPTPTLVVDTIGDLAGAIANWQTPGPAGRF